MTRLKPVVKLGQLRQQAGLTQSEVAKLLGVTENTLANWETGRSGTNWIKLIVQMCVLYECDVKDLIEYHAEINAKAAQVEELSIVIGQRRTLEELQKLIGTDKLA